MGLSRKAKRLYIIIPIIIIIIIIGINICSCCFKQKKRSKFSKYANVIVSYYKEKENKRSQEI